MTRIVSKTSPKFFFNSKWVLMSLNRAPVYLSLQSTEPDQWPYSASLFYHPFPRAFACFWTMRVASPTLYPHSAPFAHFRFQGDAFSQSFSPDMLQRAFGVLFLC